MAERILVVGASRGIGLEMIRQACANDADVIGTARSENGLNAIAALGAQALRVDVINEEQLNVAASGLEAPIDLLICNAGVYRGRGGLNADDSGADAWEETLMTNVAGPFLAARAFLPKLRTPGGKIAIISSKMGSSAHAPGNGYLYRASKAAATNVACNLAAELRDRGIAVGSYHPGWVRTDMGGSGADISVEESASGLLARFGALSLATSGVFEDYAGEALPF